MNDFHAPDAFSDEYIYAFRAWKWRVRIERPVLRSVSHDHVWLPGQSFEAECDRDPKLIALRAIDDLPKNVENAINRLEFQMMEEERELQLVEAKISRPWDSNGMPPDWPKGHVPLSNLSGFRNPIRNEKGQITNIEPTAEELGIFQEAYVIGRDSLKRVIQEKKPEFERSKKAQLRELTLRLAQVEEECAVARAEIEAKDWTKDVEPPPHEDCQCGIYTSKDWERQQSAGYWNNELVFGVVRLWGKVLAYQYGYKSQFAEPVCLWVPYDPAPALVHVNVPFALLALPVLLMNHLAQRVITQQEYLNMKLAAELEEDYHIPATPIELKKLKELWDSSDPQTLAMSAGSVGTLDA